MGAPMAFRTGGRVPSGGGSAVEAVRARAAQFEIPLTEEASRLTLSIWGAEANLLYDETDVAIELGAPEERILRTLQDALTELLGDRGLAVDWEDVAEGALAPGLSLMTVVSVTERSPGFLRVRVTGSDAQRFARGGLHFRLLLPPDGRPPRWPRIAASGRTAWPDGDDAMHRRVYTTAVQGDDWLEFDVFRHAGSPTCAWAEGDPVGQTVGIMGPGGGSCPDASPLFFFGDETALPAIARMLDLADGEARAFLRVAEEDLCDLARDPRVTRVPDLAEALAQTYLPKGAHVWFAGEAVAAKAARAHLAERGLARRAFTAVAYWS